MFNNKLLRRRKNISVAFASFYGINASAMAYFKLATQHHLAHKIPEALTADFHEPV